MKATSLRDVARWAVVAGTLGVAAAYASAFGSARLSRAGEGLMAIALPVLLLGVLGLGALSRRAASRAWGGRLALTFVAMAAWLALGFLLALRTSAPRADAPLLLGLPWPAALVLYGVGVVPLVVLPALFAWSEGRANAASGNAASGTGESVDTPTR